MCTWCCRGCNRCCRGVGQVIRFAIKLAPFLIAATFVVSFIRNENTYGDEWRHRPFWLVKPMNTWMFPSIVLSKERFIYGDEDPLTLEGLEVILESLDTEAVLTKFGRILAYNVLRDAQYQRWCVNKALNLTAQQRVQNYNFEPPTIVIGLPRTSTTFLHGLLSTDEKRFRAPRFHEYMSACPAARNDGGTIVDWIRIQIQSFKPVMVRWFFPKMSTFHHLDGNSPDEDVIPLGHTLISALFPTTFYMPSYQKWLQTDSHRKLAHSLKYLKRYLDEHLRYDNRQWLLKTPWHLVQIEELNEVFPGARFIWTHRDPVDQASSLASLANQMVGITSDRPYHPESRQLIANETIDFWYWVLERGVEARKRLTQKGVVFVDVSSDSINKDAVGVAKAIYRKFGWLLEREQLERFERHTAENRLGNKFGVHKHSLDQFHVDETLVRQRYAEITSGIQWNFVD